MKVKRTAKARRFEVSVVVMFEVAEEVGAPEPSLVVVMKRSLEVLKQGGSEEVAPRVGAFFLSFSSPPLACA